MNQDQRETFTVEQAYHRRLWLVKGGVLSLELMQVPDNETWDVTGIVPSRWRGRYNITAQLDGKTVTAGDIPKNALLRFTDAEAVLNHWTNDWRHGNNREAAL